MLLRSSRIAAKLSKLAANVPAIPGLAGPNAALLTPGNPKATASRRQRDQVAHDKLKTWVALQSSTPGYVGGGAPPVDPHGFESRLLRPPAPTAKLKRKLGPRAYAPRISAPSP